MAGLKTLSNYIDSILYMRLKHHNWNRTKAAESLDVSVRWVRIKIKELRAAGLEVPNNPTSGIPPYRDLYAPELYQDE